MKSKLHVLHVDDTILNVADRHGNELYLVLEDEDQEDAGIYVSLYLAQHPASSSGELLQEGTAAHIRAVSLLDKLHRTARASGIMRRLADLSEAVRELGLLAQEEEPAAPPPGTGEGRWLVRIAQVYSAPNRYMQALLTYIQAMDGCTIEDPDMLREIIVQESLRLHAQNRRCKPAEVKGYAFAVHPVVYGVTVSGLARIELQQIKAPLPLPPYTPYGHGT
ncbi:MAG: hypothetical protein NW241_10925 [Bacteroidia bacterium]|nr:hypothetical protein [Bacteroidia bacterium]